eukprot:CAMPEP_0119102122 /NCGR_PEP_ID=MMETSP1180-20130426/980_1 /TAXON_ID=3052 ORGANISM="Chlamydomonas cf sp, Strain CCMP681" /NCGR_SAMPLE_ID=MMETSP1180 /ASSEMBLY_ACC=CAM_ASM_000741 /LENGTH=116 /DNA_ID=CAMNT_0007086355 /DNA_START=743 /DNA_END=1090 /DNA_ORIENTATION=-
MPCCCGKLAASAHGRMFPRIGLAGSASLPVGDTDGHELRGGSWERLVLAWLVVPVTGVVLDGPGPSHFLGSLVARLVGADHDQRGARGWPNTESHARPHASLHPVTANRIEVALAP